MSHQLSLLEKTHNQFGHLGIYKMINLIVPQYYWPYANKDIENYVKHCHTYQINNKCKQKRFGLLQEVKPIRDLFSTGQVPGLPVEWRLQIIYPLK